MEKRQKGRVVLESAEAFQLREPGVSYLVDFGPKNDDIGADHDVFSTVSRRQFMKHPG
jgi:hypothetical protein